MRQDVFESDSNFQTLGHLARSTRYLIAALWGWGYCLQEYAGIGQVTGFDIDIFGP
jgi:hypothetical protein